MTQPKFAPITQEDEVRPAYRLEPPAPWRGDRPGELRPGATLNVRGVGVPGPDQGYALHLARLFKDRLVLEPGERADDVLAGAVAIGLRRASLFGRAPVASDIELPLALFGYLASAPPELEEERRRLFAGVSHDYGRRRSLAESIPESALRSTPEAVRNAAGTGGSPELLGI
ncbi:MAG: hypothetical protein JWO62_3184 [Acidimicrobiaceae bacterium]|jgi:hypothetical protein|nr:hypothetical protein [Acidimicrobiaceae bacterium]